MAYSGFLLKIGNYTIPHSIIKFDSYSAYVNMQDLDPYTDANGYLHREALELKVPKVEFETKPLLTNLQLSEFLSNIQENYTIPKARQCIITAYIPEFDSYVTQTGYLADFQPSIYRIEENVIYYNPFRMAFIGGVADD